MLDALLRHLVNNLSKSLPGRGHDSYPPPRKPKGALKTKTQCKIMYFMFVLHFATGKERFHIVFTLFQW